MPTLNWKDLLYSLLPQKPLPLLSTPTQNLSAAAQWSYLKIWKDHFRNAGAKKGQAVVISLRPSPAWVILVLAAFWENLTVIFCDHSELKFLPTSNYFCSISVDSEATTWRVNSELELFEQGACQPEARSDYQDRVLFFGKKVSSRISDEELKIVLSRLAISGNNESVLSTLDWSTEAGFYFDFFPSYFSAREIFLADDEDRNRIKQLFDDYEINHLVCKESTYEEIAHLKSISKNPNDFISCTIIRDSQLTKKLDRFLYGNFPSSNKGNTII
ncbi:hypothetical protein EHQ58_00875 [Leptospira ognonensis]|uniref:AMP-dependent synthetase/ligase domain-containing protein n=1 Tax=Leptospira ognonensis TaxID=2484945 RepID=A0A4R9KDN5_9LEPT|nr:hypothetical protein [Leptospira ognonensis]TGL63949.1 hypothetical protein EHQ58_00875 [Leptospira ognonensis]